MLSVQFLDLSLFMRKNGRFCPIACSFFKNCSFEFKTPNIVKFATMIEYT